MTTFFPALFSFPSWSHRGLCVLAALGFSLSMPARAASGSEHDLRVGFYLLHDVCNKETQVHLITLIKTTPARETDYVGRISRLADGTLAIVTRLEEGDSSLAMEDNPLPTFEQKVRSSIRADKQHQLLFGTSGPDFARALLVTQIEAANYILHIARNLAEEDTDADRAATLRKVSSRWLAIRNEGFRLLDRS
jgi:hypothetical protein